MSFTRPVRRRVVLLSTVLAALLSACGGGGDGGGVTPPPPSPGTLALSIPSAAVSLTSGGTGTVTINITRGGSFSGTVSLSVSGLPTGVTSSFTPPTLDATSTSAVLTLTAAPTAQAAVATLTVSATGSGVTPQSAPVQLVVTQPAIALAATPTALTIGAGLTGLTTISIGRSAGFTGAVTLALDNPPAGITATFNTSPTTANSSVVTLLVGSGVTPGTYPVSIKGTAPGAQDKLVSVSLSVTAALPIGFSATVDPVEMELPAGKGWSGNGIVTVQRLNGFTGPVTVSVAPLVQGGAFGVSPSVIPATETATNIIGLSLDAAAPGVYSTTVRVSAAGFADQLVPVRLRVSAPTTGNISWRFCNASRVPKWFAVRDGNGAWQHIVPAGPAAPSPATPTTFSFSLSQATASVAMVELGEKTSASPLIAGHNWTVYYMTAQEIVEQAARECVRWPDVPTRTATGTLTGYTAFDAVLASASRHVLASAGSTGVPTTTLSLRNVQPGPFDLFVSRSSFTGGGNAPIVPQSFILKRGLDPAAGGSVGALSFATDGAPPASAAVTFGNTNNETFSVVQSFLTADGLNAPFTAAAAYVQAARTWYGVPPNRVIAGDLHQLVATTGTTTARRAVIAYAQNVGARTLDFGPALATPALAAGPTSAPWLLRATGTLSADYVSRFSLYLRESLPDPRTMTIVATRGWLGAGSAYDVSIPDLSAATGFTHFWNIRRGGTVSWTATGGEGDTGGPFETFCILSGVCPVKAVDGAVYKSAQRTVVVAVP